MRPAQGTWVDVGHRGARTGEDGFVSVLGGMSRDLQLLRTDEVGWDFLQGGRTILRKTLSMLLASPRRGGAGPTGNGTLTRDLWALPETPAAGMSPVLTPAVVGHLTDSPC